LMNSTKKTTTWVCENYSTIFLPKFETQKMVSKRQRKISSKTARKTLTWSHYRFKTLVSDQVFRWSTNEIDGEVIRAYVIMCLISYYLSLFFIHLFILFFFFWK
jgi:hypothetical protein